MSVLVSKDYIEFNGSFFNFSKELQHPTQHHTTSVASTGILIMILSISIGLIINAYIFLKKTLIK
jgi:hypothetical protein